MPETMAMETLLLRIIKMMTAKTVRMAIRMVEAL